LEVIGGKDCKSVTKTPAHGETFKIGERINVKALHTPCHTQDSICFFLEDGDQRAVFTGDTLFTGGKRILTPVRQILGARSDKGSQGAEDSSKEMQLKCTKL
jgi:glyoxylase-like metal-dependent hydrolase (beta-lactamase superfamily II)